MSDLRRNIQLSQEWFVTIILKVLARNNYELKQYSRDYQKLATKPKEYSKCTL